MKTSRSSSRWKLPGAIGIVLAAGAGVMVYTESHRPAVPLASAAGTVRPWTDPAFQKLCHPVPSPGTPMAVSYQAEARPVAATEKLRRYPNVIEVLTPAAEYIPKFELISFDAEKGFSAGASSGTVRWIASSPYESPEGDEPFNPTPLDAYHPDGSRMTEEEISENSLLKEDRKAWGMELYGEIGTGMRMRLDLRGFENLQTKVRDTFDANSHVSVQRSAYVRRSDDSYLWTGCLGMLHDAPLVTVIDLAHGPTQDFTIPVTAGAIIKDANFTLEVMHVVNSPVHGTSTDWTAKRHSIKMGFDENPTEKGKKFAVVYHVSPPSMVNAVSVDAVDASGNTIENLGRFMEESAPVSNFGAPLSTAVSLRVRYRPYQTRLLVNMNAMPGAMETNRGTRDLFDVKAPKVMIRDAFQMRNLISITTQLKDVTGTWSYDTPKAFPMKFTNVSPREIAQRYLALDSGRRITIDPQAMTIAYEPLVEKTLIRKMIEWVKSIL